MRSVLMVLVLAAVGCHESAPSEPITATPVTSASASAATTSQLPPTSATSETSAVAAAEPVLPGVVVQLTRDVCYGRCPSYVVTVFEDGRVEYEGRDFVVTGGKKSATVDAKTIEAIRKAFDDAKFLKMGDYAYDPSTDPTDGPTCTLYYASGGVAHLLHHYAGAARAPAELGPLEALVDKSVDIEKWIGTEAERTKASFGHGR